MLMVPVQLGGLDRQMLGFGRVDRAAAEWYRCV